MGLPGYSLTNPSVAGDLTLFPVSFTWDSDTIGVDEEILRNVTNGGVLTEYELFHRTVLPGLVFRFSRTQFTNFETFLTATRAIAFWLVPDSSVMATKYNCRRKPGLLPKAGEPAYYSGTLEQRFAWTLQVDVLVPDQPLED